MMRGLLLSDSDPALDAIAIPAEKVRLVNKEKEREDK